jgi:GT2 family glycosyltransferase
VDYFPGLDIVVVNYKSPGDLWAFLNSYNNVKPQLPHALHVVNVQPEDGDRRVAQEWAQEFRFLYTEHDNNVGYATACNLAVQLPDREAVAFFNADTKLEWGVLETCHAELMRHDDWGVLGPRQVNEANRITSAGVFGTMSSPSLRGWQEIDDGRTYSDIRPDAVSVSGSAYFVKRSVWDELKDCQYYMGCPEVWARKPRGAFLPTQHYYEETYLSYHAQAHDYKVVYYGPTRMVHNWSSEDASDASTLYWKDSQDLFRAACEFHDMEHD